MGGLLVAEEKLFGVEAPLRSAGLLLVTAVVAVAVVAGAAVAGAVVGSALVAAIGVNSVAETTLINLLDNLADSDFAPGAAASSLDAAGGTVLAAVADSGCFSSRFATL